MWDPGQYLRYAGERGRPFFDLLGRVGADEPGYVVDLGCGPGNLTAALAGRWPAAEIVGVDSSPEMIAAAQREAAQHDRLSFTLGDVRDWQPGRKVDVLVSNAVLQWVPGHMDVVRRWPGLLSPGGWLAFQLPGNFDQPTHAILLDLVRSDRWAPLLRGVALNRQAGSPADYLDLLAREGCSVDAWETTYLHVLSGPDPVVEVVPGHRAAPRPCRAGPRSGRAVPRRVPRTGDAGLPGGALWDRPAVPQGVRGRPGLVARGGPAHRRLCRDAR
jgi:trans-aconitate 2-methyltransferase